MFLSNFSPQGKQGILDVYKTSAACALRDNNIVHQARRAILKSFEQDEFKLSPSYLRTWWHSLSAFGDYTIGHLVWLFVQGFFFAPSAVRPSSPVAVEQNEWLFTIFGKKHRAKARADDRNPPSQDCSPHPAEKQHRSNKANKTENAKYGEIRSQWLPCTENAKNRTQRLSIRYWPVSKSKSSQLTGKKQRSQSP